MKVKRAQLGVGRAKSNASVGKPGDNADSRKSNSDVVAAPASDSSVRAVRPRKKAGKV